ncbi:ABC transporter substrate-binding protein [Inconstantimicrobium mannanitabidum]|uniref:Spermidine/putrescine ABC transporter substrate-binding protein n=1 Tax=Inconstantimicrobium mannanitabidum TaxID=1604901 RepID=A0ACB5RAC8_9CLOT|nr:spermidine/putrescine ABC transporter substrate-binding protein [Clostridium sp. TW13]GKX65991.1 spermidine/putrescine ABC transporter substrate-binding protein [Clostridium sp. TW13]
MKKFKRLAILFFIPILISSSFAGCAIDSNRTVLHLFNAGDYIDEDLLSQFEDETGIEVSMDIFETNEMMYQKVKKGDSGYDLIIPSDYMIEKMKKENLLDKIDFDNIPNYQNIDDNFKNLSYDPKNEYSVPYFWGTYGIMYNKKVVSDPVDSWSILWNPKYKGKILMLDAVRDSMGVALKKLGYSLNTVNQDQINAARDELLKQRSLVKAYVGDEVKELMSREEASLAVMYSGDYLTVKQNNEDLAYAIPKEGTNKWFDAMVIPKNAKNKSAAEQFIDFMLDPEVAKQNAEYVGYSTPNKAAFELLDPSIKSNKLLYPEKSLLDKCEIFKDLGENISKYDDAWFQVKSK